MARFGPGGACYGPSATVGGSLPSCLRGNSCPSWSPRVFWYSDRPLPRTPGRWPCAVRGAQVVVIDGPGGLPARRLVLLIAYGPPPRLMGLYETREPHDRRMVRRLRDMLLATLCMAGYQPEITYELLGLALRPSR